MENGNVAMDSGQVARIAEAMSNRGYESTVIIKYNPVIRVFQVDAGVPGEIMSPISWWADLSDAISANFPESGPEEMERDAIHARVESWADGFAPGALFSLYNEVPVARGKAVWAVIEATTIPGLAQVISEVKPGRIWIVALRDNGRKSQLSIVVLPPSGERKWAP